MLKIKDDYDLNNLKKYGFEHFSYWDFWKLNLEYSEYYTETKDRIIDIFTAMEECPINLDVLYNMIQDGIVERID